ncbi:SPFH domain-containing protein [Alkalimonas collagenimarina]|uniref:SPFH domain-containing protein n=1 Tax=Alkalimonas collagenimarina TaxID=400390 RepID=A0ABT9H154_9GAMM|nr:SPFH domain-containing protein [Alkalimonas collagenimarina]MDP4537049.1 SPFH domain-containing protein [Alkalimonas collagenimarina]
MAKNTSIRAAGAAVLGIFILLFAVGSFYTVDEGERGVVIRYGSLINVAEPGLHFKLPVIDSVRKISVQEQVELYRNMEAYSNDQQPAVMNLSVRYQIDSSRVDEVYRNFGTRQALIDRQVTRIVLEEAKTVLGQFNAATSIRERGRLNLEMAQAVQKSVTGPVIILGVQVEDVSFSSAYEESVEQRMLAEVAVERERQNLERERVEADIVRTRAAAEADRVRAQAQAEADSIRLRGNAEAEAIRERAGALADNPLLVELVKAENWDGKLPTTMLPNSTVPFIEANK